MKKSINMSSALVEFALGFAATGVAATIGAAASSSKETYPGLTRVETARFKRAVRRYADRHTFNEHNLVVVFIDEMKDNLIRESRSMIVCDDADPTVGNIRGVIEDQKRDTGNRKWTGKVVAFGGNRTATVYYMCRNRLEKLASFSF